MKVGRLTGNVREFLKPLTLGFMVSMLPSTPLFAEVESDIVGYTAVEMQAGKWYQIGNPFVGLDGSAETRLNDVFVDGFQDGDSLVIYDAETSRYGRLLQWVSQANSGKGAWCASRINATPDETILAPGQAIFITKRAEGTLTFKGKVQAVKAEFGSTDINQWAQVAVISPVTRDVNEFTWTGMNAGDTMVVLDSETGKYSRQYYWQPNRNGTGAWCTSRMATAPLAKVTLTPGQAVFISKVVPEGAQLTEVGGVYDAALPGSQTL